HTPDGLENVLRSVRETTVGRVILLFGCGGDRDVGKRPEMGRVASRMADLVIITSDNPRSEDPDEIIRQILQGVEGIGYRVIPDRKEAIRAALRLAKTGDTVLLAGKGHETSQILSDRTIRCDEREIAREILKEEGY
ncbi:MAG: UDP-N-acetylmuramoyl-L-alanyl-D-glutamate--2,6-diaminopimelate ligase, partial [Clostridia bacterium]|nr:UDP-N-acetylmuramoyl-L-alanyl-D-glutamate--2,6-diaminopimelate ligase [Clostridia bacterium]